MTVSTILSRSSRPGGTGATRSVEVRASGVTKTCASMYCRAMNISAPNWHAAITSTVCQGVGCRSRIPASSTSPRAVPAIRCRPRLTRCRVVWPTSGTTAATIAQ